LIIHERVTRFPTDREAKEYHGSNAKGYYSNGDYVVTNAETQYDKHVDKLISSQKSTLVRLVKGRAFGYLITNPNGDKFAGRRGIAPTDASHAVLYFDEKDAITSMRFRTSTIWSRVTPVHVKDGKIIYWGK